MKIMENIYQGNLVATNLKVAVVVARFNEFITSKLLGGAKDALIRHGAQEADIHTIWLLGLSKFR